MSQYISKWRSFIMGFSILWIILYHAPFQVSISIISSFINRGYIGVEMFLLVSGYGLYYSIANRKIIDFYKRRFIRVYPEFLIVVVLAFFLSGLSSSLDCILWKLSTIGFWIVNKPFYCWYISLIFILYVLFPLFSKLLEKNFSFFFIIIIIICILLSICMFPFYNVVRLMDLFSHIPIFLTGAALGYISYHEKFRKYSFSIKDILIWSISLIIICSIITLVCKKMVFDYRLLWNPFICWPFSLGLVGMLVAVAELLFRFVIGRFVIKCISLCGFYSLELYIIHGEGYFNNIVIWSDWGLNKNELTLLFILLLFPLSLALKKTNDWFVKNCQMLRR